MKRAQQYLNEKLSVSGKAKEYSPGILGQIERALPDLEEEIYNILGPDSRAVELGLIVKHNQIKDTYDIISDNLVDLTGPIGKYTYDEFRFETSLLKIDENNILNEYFYYFDDNVLKCLAIYQFPKGDEINGVLLINKNRNISNQVIIKVSDQENFYPTVYVGWHPNHEFLLEENGLEKVEVKINDFSNEILLPQETMIIDLYYQGKSKEQKLDFEDFLYDTGSSGTAYLCAVRKQ